MSMPVLNRLGFGLLGTIWPPCLCAFLLSPTNGIELSNNTLRPGFNEVNNQTNERVRAFHSLKSDLSKVQLQAASNGPSHGISEQDLKPILENISEIQDKQGIARRNRKIPSLVSDRSQSDSVCQTDHGDSRRLCRVTHSFAVSRSLIPSTYNARLANRRIPAAHRSIFSPPLIHVTRTSQ